MRKWQKIVTICLLVANAIILIYQRNWVALIWEIGCAFFLYHSLRADTNVAYLEEVLRTQHSHYTHKRLIEAERKSECYLANCNKALKKMMILKNLNEGLFSTINDLKAQIADKDLLIKELRKNGKQ